MNWLIDAQLPQSLCQWIHAKGDLATHVASLNGGTSLPDATPWSHAAQHQLVIISKDSDFFDRGILTGPPPQVVYIRVGNCSHRTLFALLDRFWLQMKNALAQGAAVIEVSRERIRAY